MPDLNIPNNLDELRKNAEYHIHEALKYQELQKANMIAFQETLKIDNHQRQRMNTAFDSINTVPLILQNLMKDSKENRKHQIITLLFSILTFISSIISIAIGCKALMK